MATWVNKDHIIMVDQIKEKIHIHYSDGHRYVLTKKSQGIAVEEATRLAIDLDLVKI